MYRVGSVHVYSRYSLNSMHKYGIYMSAVRVSGDLPS